MNLYIPSASGGSSNKPDSIQRGTGNYTCPAGKHARVTISTSGVANSIPSSSVSVASMASSGGHFNETLSIWLNSGDVISNSLVTASGSTVAFQNFATGASGSTTSTINYNGNPIAVFLAQTIGSISPQNGNGSIQRTGSSNYHFYAEEFNN